MTDIAQLGLAVDSSPVEKARDHLNQFASSAKSAEAAAGSMGKTTGRAFDGVSRTVAASGTRLDAFVKQYDRATNARLTGIDGNAKQRAQDIAAYGEQLDNLRAKFNPLFAAEQKHLSMVKQIAAAQLVGALTQTEASLAVLASENDYRKQALAINASNAEMTKSGQRAALTGQAMTNLGFQLNDVATQAALGMDPLRILAAQGGQFFQIFQQGEGGVRGSLGYIGGLIRGLITPFRLATGGALAFAATAVYLRSSWRDAQREINLALIGTGAAARITAGDVNAISLAAANTGRTTVGEARSMALAFASTGKIGSGLTQELVGMSSAFGKLYGESAVEGADRLAKIFADPAKGVEELNKRLAAFDAATVDNVKSLTEQGRRLEAQKVLVNGMRSAIEQASQQTGGWANLWDRLTSSMSRFGALAGRALDSATGGGTDNSLQAQLAQARANLEAAQAGRRNRSAADSRTEIAAASREVERLSAMLERANKAAADAPGIMRSLDYAAAVDAAVPNLQALREATDALEKLKAIQSDSDGAGGMSAQQQAAVGRAIQLREEEVASIRLKIDNQRTSLEIAQEDNAFAMRSIDARSAAQRAELAFQQTLAREQRNGNVNAQFEAQAAKMQVLAEAARQVSDQVRARNFAAQQSIELAQLDVSLVGKTADEAARIRAEFEAVQGVRAQAFSDFRKSDPQEEAAAADAARRKIQYESDLRRQQFTNDLAFERDQMTRSQGEQEVYARLRSEGMLENNQISAAGELYAARLRQLNLDKEIYDLEKEFGASLVRDLVAGKSATEALSSALQNLATRLIDSSFDKLFNSLGTNVFGGGSGSGSTASGGPGLFASIFHDGGHVGNDNVPMRAVPASLFAGAKRYHGGGVIGADEVPAILQKGERVLKRGQTAAGGGVSVTIPITVNAQGAYPESIADINAALAQINASIPSRVVDAVREARSRGAA